MTREKEPIPKSSHSTPSILHQFGHNRAPNMAKSQAPTRSQALTGSRTLSIVFSQSLGLQVEVAQIYIQWQNPCQAVVPILDLFTRPLPCIAPSSATTKFNRCIFCCVAERCGRPGNSCWKASDKSPRTRRRVIGQPRLRRWRDKIGWRKTCLGVSWSHASEGMLYVIIP